MNLLRVRCVYLRVPPWLNWVYEYKCFLTTEGQEVCTEDMEEIVLKLFARGRYHQASAMFIVSKTNTDVI
jgi:hypothetical protein